MEKKREFSFTSLSYDTVKVAKYGIIILQYAGRKWDHSEEGGGGG